MLVGQALGVWDKAAVISIEQNSLHYKQGNLYETSFTTGSYYCIQCHPSLVPRPHSLTRRNGLVNRVKFLGLGTLLRQCNLATFKKKLSKKVRILKSR